MASVYRVSSVSLGSARPNMVIYTLTSLAAELLRARLAADLNSTVTIKEIDAIEVGRHVYVEIDAPSGHGPGTHWSTAPTTAGQHIEVQYLSHGRSEGAIGSQYRRVIDHSQAGETTYYMLVSGDQ